ncbi:MAG: peptidoglycan-binding protein, partial [Gemmiger sp.]
MPCPAWPEQALRANILAQITLALNRVYTEWYPSRGYSFNITGSPGYDQAYVSGRTVFAVMEKLTAELFNTYVRRTGDAEPYFTEYCDGKLVTCPGMKQWGTVDRANEGMSALQILRYYYGNRVQLVTTNNIAAIPESYPGTPLRRGDTGTAVSILQKQLSRIAKDYPAFGKPAVTGTFDAATESTVKAFQKQFSLTADGIVGRATWYKISYIYVSVKDLAELTSEGETLTGTESAGGWPGVVLRRGSTGRNVETIQFWLSGLAQFSTSLPSVTVDGNYGAATENAVRAFQRQQGLTVDGVVGQATWDALYAAWVSAQSDVGGLAWPGTALRQGATGVNVRLVQFWLRMAADNYSALSTVTVDGVYGAGTTAAVTAFQTLFGLTADGVVGRATWNKLNEVALAVANNLVEPNVAPGQFTGTVQQGSTGTAVRAVQYYLRLLSAYYSDIPSVTVDGNFGPATRRAVIAWQQHAGLTADGSGGRLT